MVAGGDRDGYFFLDADAPAMDRAFDALYRYRALVNPQLAERFSVWIEVLDEPCIITFQGSPAIGLLGDVVAIAGGTREVFVDARSDSEQLASPARRRPRSSAPARLPPAIRRRRPSRAWSRLSRRVTVTPGRACSPNGASSQRMRRGRRCSIQTTACCRRTSRTRGRPRAV